MNRELDEVQKEELMEILTNELPVLRAKVGLSQQELANRMGVSRQTYGMIETKKQKIAWQSFITLLLLFKNNPDTARIIEWIEACPPELEKYLMLSNNFENCKKDI